MKEAKRDFVFLIIPFTFVSFYIMGLILLTHSCSGVKTTISPSNISHYRNEGILTCVSFSFYCCYHCIYCHISAVTGGRSAKEKRKKQQQYPTATLQSCMKDHGHKEMICIIFFEQWAVLSFCIISWTHNCWMNNCATQKYWMSFFFCKLRTNTATWKSLDCWELAGLHFTSS